MKGSFHRLLLGVASLCAFPLDAMAEEYETWLVDQSNTNGVTYGGSIYIFDGNDTNGSGSATPIDVIDIAGDTAALCLASTGALPVRPHMLLFNGAQDHAVLAFVASGHVVIYDAATRMPVSCIRTSVGAGGARQAHAAFPSEDDTYILVANQNGKLLERIDTNYATDTYTLDPSATIDLANCTTPNGIACQAPGIRPDTAPICPIIDDSSNYGFITLRGGGLFVVDPRATPMQIVAEYDTTAIAGNGCGGVDTASAMFLDSGGGTATNLGQFDVYRLPVTGFSPSNVPNTPVATRIYTDPAPDRDAHGMTLTKGDRYLWVFDRHDNVAEIFDTTTNAHVRTFSLVSPFSADPTPDLVDISPSGNRMLISLRGPIPLSGDPHASTGSNPGMMVLQITQGGANAQVKSLTPISNVDAGGLQRADAHGIRVRTIAP